MKQAQKIDLYEDLLPTALLDRKIRSVDKPQGTRRIDVERLRRATLDQPAVPYGIVEKMREDDRF